MAAFVTLGLAVRSLGEQNACLLGHRGSVVTSSSSRLQHYERLLMGMAFRRNRLKEQADNEQLPHEAHRYMKLGWRRLR